MKPLCVLITVALAGCSTIPSPQAPLPETNAQVRLSELSGAVEAGVAGASGTSCVLTVLGRLPLGVAAVMQQGTCMAQIAGQADP